MYHIFNVVSEMQSFMLIGLVQFLHDLFTAIWIGGLVTMAVAVLPSLRKVLGMNPQTKMLSETIMSRLSKLVMLSMVGLLLTGIMMSNRSPLFEGFFAVTNEYSMILTIKHILIAVMVVLSLLRSQGLSRMGLDPKKETKISMVILILNLIVGISVLFMSGLLSALSTMGL